MDGRFNKSINSLIKELELEKKYHHMKLYQDWPHIIGFNKSKYITIKKVSLPKLVLEVRSSVLIQEVMQQKKEIIKKINTFYNDSRYIQDIHVQLKEHSYIADIKNPDLFISDYEDPVLNLENITISTEEEKKVEHMLQSVKDDKLNLLLKEARINSLKRNQYYKKEGYKVCTTCGEWHNTEYEICRYCYEKKRLRYERSLINEIKTILTKHPTVSFEQINNYKKETTLHIYMEAKRELIWYIIDLIKEGKDNEQMGFILTSLITQKSKDELDSTYVKTFVNRYRYNKSTY